MKYANEKKEAIYWAKKLNERGFVTARSGNISLKVAEGLLITSHDCYLGELTNDDILLVDLEGNIIKGDKELTSEKSLHLGIHNKFPRKKAVLHSHSPYTIAFFHYFDKLDIFSFEAKFYLGDVKVVSQATPTVTEIEPVLKELENSNIVVLGRHGVVSTGKDFKEAFSLIELLEEQAKVNLMLKAAKPYPYGHKQGHKVKSKKDIILKEGDTEKNYKLLSKEHAEKLVELVNNDKGVQELGKKYDLTCTLAVKDMDTGRCICFYYREGKITKTDNTENAEFIISGESGVLKKIFNREIDPFVASTQGKVKTKGDFTKMSRWYPVLVRTFKLWEQAPVI